MKIGVVIRKARIDAGLSQDGLAYLAHMSRPYISNIERGRVMPSLDQITRIAIALETRASSLIIEAEAVVSDVIPAHAVNYEQIMP